MIPAPGVPTREAAAGPLTRPAAAFVRLAAPIPSHTTWVAVLVTAALVIMLCAVLAAAVARDLGPDPDPRHLLLRALLALGLAILAAAAGVSLGAGN